MRNINVRLFGRICSTKWFSGAALAAGTALLLVVISCQSVNRSAVMLPEVPGAKYVGSKECEQCHDKIYRDFATADHARLVAEGPNALSAGCESCHGPGSLHAESGGETKPPFSFTSGRPEATSFGARVGSPLARTVETACFQCHPEVRGQFNLPSHHGVPEGKMSCTDCHPPPRAQSTAAAAHHCFPPTRPASAATRHSAGLMSSNMRRCGKAAPPATIPTDRSMTNC